MLNKKTYCILVALFLAFIYSCDDPGKYDSNEESPENDTADSNGCKIDDGEHDATVDYFNPNTGHKATYNLTVEVEDCEVTTIYFPKGGWLDDSHISPTEIDEEGNASIEDDEGRSFEVHIDE